MEKQKPIKAYVIIHPDFSPVGRIIKIKDRVICIDCPAEGQVMSKKLMMDFVSSDGQKRTANIYMGDW